MENQKENNFAAQAPEQKLPHDNGQTGEQVSERAGQRDFDRSEGRSFDRNSDRGFNRNSERGFDRNSERPAIKRPPLRETIMTMDQDILKMLARRSNILDKMKAKHGHLDPKEEKTLRTSWEKNATQMTRDPRVIQQIFALFQEIEFSAKPEYGDAKRTSFNLSPTKDAIDLNMQAPLVSRRARLYLSLAAVAGTAMYLRPALLNDSEVECIKMFNQCATSIAWDDDGTLLSREGGGLSLPDKVIFVGDDALNFYLLLGHYVGKTTRAKFTGESSLKFADFTPLRSFLPQLGARLSNAIPGTSGFPLRLECSGVLPDLINIPNDIDADAVLGLILAAPHWDIAVKFDLKKHAQAQDIIEEALSVLQPCGANITVDGTNVQVSPGEMTPPKEPNLGMDMSFAAYLLALPTVTHGKVQLEGLWPKCALGDSIKAMLEQCGANITLSDEQIESSNPDAETKPNQEKLDASSFDERFVPLALALALMPALKGEKAQLPALPDTVSNEEIQLFINHFGFELGVDDAIIGIPHFSESELAWTASSPYWAMAYALCAFKKPNLKLANPGIMTTLYPQFWNLYNALPYPYVKKPTELVDEKPVRRRIIAADQDGTGSGDSAD